MKLVFYQKIYHQWQVGPEFGINRCQLKNAEENDNEQKVE